MPIFRMGSWGTPELGITEFVGGLLGSGRTSQGGSNILGSSKAQTPSTSTPVNYNQGPMVGPAYSGPQGQVLGAATGGGGTPAPTGQPASNPIMEQDINRQVNDMGSIIDRDFESALNELGAQEQNLRGTASTAEQSVRAQQGQVKTALGEQKSAAEQGLVKEEQTAQKQSSNAIREARDLARSVQNRNQAWLSSQGISSSSVAEALSERLGVETARRIAGVTGSRDEILQNIQAERSRISNVYQQKVTDLETSVSSQIAEIQNNLMSGLRQINSARQAAANDKANARAELLSRAQSEVASLRAKAADYQQQLQTAAQNRAQSLKESLSLLTAKPADFNNFLNNIKAISPALQSAGLQFSDINPKGSFTLAPVEVNSEDDELDSVISALAG